MEPSDDIPEDTGDVDQQNQAGSEDEDVLSQPSQTLQHRPKDHAEEAAEEDDVGSEENDSEQSVVIEIKVPAPERPEEYEIVAESTIVSHVVEELERPGDEIWYNIVFEDGREEEVSEFPKVLVRCFFNTFWLSGSRQSRALPPLPSPPDLGGFRHLTNCRLTNLILFVSFGSSQ